MLPSVVSIDATVEILRTGSLALILRSMTVGRLKREAKKRAPVARVRIKKAVTQKARIRSSESGAL